MRVDPGEGRAVAADGNEPSGRGGGFAGALERAGRCGRPGLGRDDRGRDDDAEARAPGGWTVDALLAEIASPGRSESLEQAAGAPLLARAVERIVLLVKSGEATSVTLEMGPSLDVRIAQASEGVEVQIHAVQGLSPMAEAELPVLVAALRARGVRVARAGVSSRRREARPSLTPRRSSATTAGDDGTVAKW
jgi:hypothetical protein